MRSLYMANQKWTHLLKKVYNTVCDNAQKCSAGHLSRYVTSYPSQLSLAIPLWVGTMSTSQRAVTPCVWGVKADMVRVWVAGNTV